jgi:hypothetical protein
VRFCRFCKRTYIRLFFMLRKVEITPSYMYNQPFIIYIKFICDGILLFNLDYFGFINLFHAYNQSHIRCLVFIICLVKLPEFRLYPLNLDCRSSVEWKLDALYFCFLLRNVVFDLEKSFLFALSIWRIIPYQGVIFCICAF